MLSVTEEDSRKMTPQPLVSISIPCRNEEKFIIKCLDSIIANDYPKEILEVLVIDGMSEDGTKEIVNTYARRHPFIKVINNPKKITSTALNTAIDYAKGNIIVWMSAHNLYERDYISRCVDCLYKYGADNVGGIIKTIPREDTFIGRAIVASISHRFGVGNSHFRIKTDEPTRVDTVFGGCYKKDVFDRIGLFNENLERGQDMEFNLRLKKAGGKILLVPDIVSYYYARSDLKSFWKHNWTNGVWTIQHFLYSTIMPVSWRHLVPLLFVTSLIGSAGVAFIERPFLWLFLAILGLYGVASLASSFQIASEKRDIRYLVAMPFIFGMLHFGYGLGSLWGVFKLLGARKFWSKLLRVVVS